MCVSIQYSLENAARHQCVQALNVIFVIAMSTVFPQVVRLISQIPVNCPLSSHTNSAASPHFVFVSLSRIDPLLVPKSLLQSPLQAVAYPWTATFPIQEHPTSLTFIRIIGLDNSFV
jgi:hypothetical protein